MSRSCLFDFLCLRPEDQGVCRGYPFPQYSFSAVVKSRRHRLFHHLMGILSGTESAPFHIQIMLCILFSFHGYCMLQHPTGRIMGSCNIDWEYSLFLQDSRDGNGKGMENIYSHALNPQIQFPRFQLSMVHKSNVAFMTHRILFCLPSYHCLLCDLLPISVASADTAASRGNTVCGP